MNDTKISGRLILWGTINVSSPIPVYVFTAFWTLLVMALFHFDDSSVIATIISALPILICPICCILGIAYGLRYWRVYRKNAIVCISLSAAGLAEFALLILIMAHLSSIV